MKFKFAFILLIAAPIFFFSCKQNKKTVSPTEIISAKTLGLAYLEENQLDEAEAEFLKLVDLDPKEVLGYANLGIVYLRKGDYQKAEKWAKNAIELNPQDPDIRLILAKILEMDNQTEKAIKELEKAIQLSPGNIKALYSLTELYSSSVNKDFLEKRYKYTYELAKYAPGNIVPQLNLTDILIHEGKADEALAEMEKLQKVFPKFPREAIEYYDKTISALRVDNIQEATVSFMIFHNYLKVTTFYQAGILELKGPGGSLIGSPIITFDQQKGTNRISDWKAILEAIKYNNITSFAGLDFINTDGKSNEEKTKFNSHITPCDYDSDGDIDLYIGHYDAQSKLYKHYLLKNERGKFTDVTSEAGIIHKGVEFLVKFADYNNDGFIDLYIIKEGANILYKNTGEGSFVDHTEEAGVGDEAKGEMALFFDYDHDGDLDLYILRSISNLLFRNNSDGSFLNQTKESGLSGGIAVSTDAAFADFDDDGDIDLFVVNKDASNILYFNQRQGVFKDVTEKSGLKSNGGSGSVTVGDYNNDGFPDLFITSGKPGNCSLFRNKGNGSFLKDKKSKELYQTLQDVSANDASFLDFDNDGFLDLFVVGKSVKKEGKGAILYHNDGTGIFYKVSGILPDDLKEGLKISTFDYNGDGDIDLTIPGINGNICLLRNDGGNNNHYVKMKLVGLRTGSGKNNYYGIGAKVEVRAGNLYQSKVVTQPGILFGLGPRAKADVIRILWTNGVPQNIFFPGTDQKLVEEQLLKGSCPFLYTWNGQEYVFAKDIMWRSALGMPLGIMGESKEYANPAASVDYIKIPGEILKPKNKKYTIQLTGELWETMYIDKIQLIALDHPDSVDVFVDERFLPPSEPGYHLYQVNEKYFPVSVTDKNGTNLLPLITEKDDKYISGFKPGKFQGVTEMTDLIIDFGDIRSSDKIHLYLNGWLFPSDASINASISQSTDLKIVSPYIQVINTKGEWETIMDNLSFPMGKDKTLIVDLSEKILTSDPRIRIRTNMEIYWDQIFFTKRDPVAPVRSNLLYPVSADLHYRGFSRTYRKGGRYGPHWFDYNEVSTDQKWRDLLGNYTRYGDVLPLLTEADDKYIIKNAGDETTIEFNAESLPELPEKWKRDFLIHSEGWVKDGDMNTATGKTVWPLPFHGMSRYPYGPEESYPSDREHQEYLKEYNTRKVTTKNFREAIIKPSLDCKK
jgi:tetratricopeptide (TPR) repeat protein